MTSLYEEKMAAYPEDMVEELERHVVLEVLDGYWRPPASNGSAS
jgi:preprotein translocase subunit SecA